MDLLHTFCLAIIPLLDRFKTYCYNNKIERIQKELLSQHIRSDLDEEIFRYKQQLKKS